jgi:hypothetical protein
MALDAHEQSWGGRVAMAALAIASAGFVWAVSRDTSADPPMVAGVMAASAPLSLDANRPLAFEEISSTEDRRNGAVTLVLSVIGYTPPKAGTVQVVVRAAAAGGVLTEAGRFGIFPDEPFVANTPDEARRYQFPVKACGAVMTTPCHVRSEVALVGIGGNGGGARLVFAPARLAITPPGGK